MQTLFPEVPSAWILYWKCFVLRCTEALIAQAPASRSSSVVSPSVRVLKMCLLGVILFLVWSEPGGASSFLESLKQMSLPLHSR